jgi:hypothetical protein
MGNILKKSGGVIAILGNLSLVKQSMGSGSRNKNLFAWILTPITAIGRAAKNTGAILSNKLGDAINDLARSAQRSGKAMTK